MLIPAIATANGEAVPLTFPIDSRKPPPNARKQHTRTRKGSCFQNLLNVNKVASSPLMNHILLLYNIRNASFVKTCWNFTELSIKIMLFPANYSFSQKSTAIGSASLKKLYFVSILKLVNGITKPCQFVHFQRLNPHRCRQSSRFKNC